MPKQLQFSFDDFDLKEENKANSLYNWCIENNKQYLLDEWDYAVNGEYTPKNVAKASNKKFAWICSKCGYKWMATPSHRIIGRGCVKCGRKNAGLLYSTVKDVNDSVKIKYPEIAKEWNYVKNERGPETYYPQSNFKVWWKCSKCGNEWETGINHRCVGNTGCPVCGGLTIKTGINDLFTLRSYLKNEWDYEKNSINPETIGIGSEEKAWWKCERGHSWQAVVYSRTSLKNPSGCPKCSAERRTSLPEKVIYYYVKKYFPEAIENYHPEFLKKRELDIYIPSSNTGIEYDGYEWHKNFSKDLLKDKLCFDNNVKLIRIREGGLCEYESTSLKIYTEKYKNDCLYLSKPLFELMKILKINDPIIDIETKYNEILNKYLSLEKENSVFKHSMIKEWDYIKNKGINPEFISIYSNRKFWWKCNECGYEWKVAPNHRARGHKCPACANQVVIKGRNDLRSQNPVLVKEWNYEKNILKPDEVTARNNKKVWWKCSKCGYEWQVTIYSRYTGCGCPECKKETIGKIQSLAPNDKNLLLEYPEIAKEWDYDKNKEIPQNVYSKSNRKYWWKCSKGHSYLAVVFGRTMHNMGCPYCSGRYAIKGENDLATLRPDLLKNWEYEKNTIKPDEVKVGSGKLAWWKCTKCGHEWQSAVNLITHGQKCPNCKNKLGTSK